jgi:hypothetical protein
MHYLWSSASGWCKKRFNSAAARSQNIWQRWYAIYMRKLCTYTLKVLNTDPKMAHAVLESIDAPETTTTSDEPETPCCGFCGDPASTDTPLIMSTRQSQYICFACVEDFANTISTLSHLDTGTATSDYKH